MTEYVVKDEDFSEYDNNKELKLQKIDRNGSHYYTSDKCPRCGGTGYLPYYDYVEGGICFMCDGSGKYGQTYKVMTEAYYGKLREKRIAKARKESAKKNAEFLEQYGFDVDGNTWVVLGNTYSIKDELKAAGAKYNGVIGWTFPFEQSKYDTVKISKDAEIAEGKTLVEEDYSYRYTFRDFAGIQNYINAAKHARELELKAERGTVSEYVGEIGEKITVSVTVEKVNWFDTHYSYYGGSEAIYTMTDDNGNQLVWKTSAGFDDPVKAGTALTITGTVKAHKEYKGEKQTELVRVKAIA